MPHLDSILSQVRTAKRLFGAKSIWKEKYESEYALRCARRPGDGSNQS